MTDNYKILGVDPKSSQDEIRAAYRKLSKKFHPDLNNGDPYFENLFKQIHEAYEILGDPEKRKEFDVWLAKHDRGELEDPIPKENPQIPLINLFVVDKKPSRWGDLIIIRWQTRNADQVALAPFGMVEAAGVKKYRFKNNESSSYHLILSACNSISGFKKTEQIEVENSNYGFQSIYFESFFSITGRIRRSVYFIRCLLLSLGFLPLLISRKDHPDVWSVSILFALSILIVIFVQTIKRLHDLNSSGWQVLFYFVPVYNVVFGAMLILKDGTKGTNRFGLDPKKRGFVPEE